MRRAEYGNVSVSVVSEGEGRQVDMVVQVEAADHSWVWLYMVLQLNIDENPISCHNYIIRYHSYTAMKYHCVICLLPLTMTSIQYM